MRNYNHPVNIFGNLGEKNIVFQAMFFITVASLIAIQDCFYTTIDKGLSCLARSKQETF